MCSSKMEVFVWCLFLFVSSSFAFDKWGEELDPRLRVNYLSQKSDTVHSFLGNATHNDHFKLLRSDGASLLIGARNVVYNLSLDDLTENREQRITWPSLERDRELCIVKGKSEDECQNYIRVLAQTDVSNLLVCGTNSFNPKCRTYSSNANDNKVEDDDDEGSAFRPKHEFSGKGFCPYDPKHNSTAIFTDGELYSGTVADFSGSDALIIRDRIRTEQYDLKHLNAPDFVSSLEDGDSVYFFFRESAVEYINCGKAVYSRVAKVCKNDVGGAHKFRNKWTTFVKARVNCSMGGDIPFYFNEIQATASHMVDAGDGSGDKVLYGVFTTGDNALGGSAVCSFRMSEITNALEDSPFKGQSQPNANWLPVRDEPKTEDGHRPGSCSSDSKSLNERTLNFLKRHTLKDAAVDADTADPLLVRASMRERLTVIAVDPQVRTADGESYDVLFVGTTRGKVLKFVSVADGAGQNRKPVVIEEMQVFPYHVAVSNIQVVKSKSSGESKLIVLSDHEVKSLPLSRCSAVQVQSCRACVRLQDPYCRWSLRRARCVDDAKEEDVGSVAQDVVNGEHAACHNEDSSYAASMSASPRAAVVSSNLIKTKKNSEREPRTNDDIDDLDTEDVEDEERGFEDDDEELLDIEVDVRGGSRTEPYYDNGQPVHAELASLYTGEQLTLASVLVAIFALLVGFAAGFVASRRVCTKDSYTSCGHHYLEAQSNLNKQNDSVRGHDAGYTSAPCNNALLSAQQQAQQQQETNTGSLTKNANLLVNVPAKDDGLKDKNNITGVTTTAIPGANANSGNVGNANATGTIGRNGTLCKKVYL